jgi:hypothetical protein
VRCQTALLALVLAGLPSFLERAAPNLAQDQRAMAALLAPTSKESRVCRDCHASQWVDNFYVQYDSVVDL